MVSRSRRCGLCTPVPLSTLQWHGFPLRDPNRGACQLSSYSGSICCSCCCPCRRPGYIRLTPSPPGRVPSCIFPCVGCFPSGHPDRAFTASVPHYPGWPFVVSHFWGRGGCSLPIFPLKSSDDDPCFWSPIEGQGEPSARSPAERPRFPWTPNSFREASGRGTSTY